MAGEGQAPHLLLRLGRDTEYQEAQDGRGTRPSTWTRRPVLSSISRRAPTRGRPILPGTGRRCLRRDGVAFQTAPFTTDTTIVGPATVNLWVEAATPVEDFQVTVTEVRPSASQEEYVTSGFLRSSNQVDLSNSTRLLHRPVVPGEPGGEPVADLLRAGEDPGRSDRPHLQSGDRTAHRHLRPRRRPAAVGVRHGRRRPDARRSASARLWPRPWSSTRRTACRTPRRCRPAARCAASRVAPIKLKATSDRGQPVNPVARPMSLRRPRTLATAPA